MLVLIESPYAGNVEANLDYARRCMRDSLERGEIPMASHLLYTQEGVLFDGYENERKLGIECGYARGEHAEAIVFYTDRGWSDGMHDACRHYGKLGKRIIERRLNTGEGGARGASSECAAPLERLGALRERDYIMRRIRSQAGLDA